MVLVGAAGFEPATSCSQTRGEPIARGGTESLPVAAHGAADVADVQKSQKEAGVRQLFATDLLRTCESLGGGTVEGRVDFADGTLLNVRQVAAYLGLCTATVYKLCSRGGLPHVRVSNAVRVRRGDLAEFLGRNQR